MAARSAGLYNHTISISIQEQRSGKEECVGLDKSRSSEAKSCRLFLTLCSQGQKLNSHWIHLRQEEVCVHAHACVCVCVAFSMGYGESPGWMVLLLIWYYYYYYALKAFVIKNHHCAREL